MPTPLVDLGLSLFSAHTPVYSAPQLDETEQLKKTLKMYGPTKHMNYHHSLSYELPSNVACKRGGLGSEI